MTDISTENTCFGGPMCHAWQSLLGGLIPSLYNSFLCFLLIPLFSKIGRPPYKKKDTEHF